MKLEYYGGSGLWGKENALYEVKWLDRHKYFGKFSEAKKFYNAIEGAKAFWDADHSELLDAWHWVPEYDGEVLPD